MKGVKGILLAAGNGERFGDPIPKQFHLLEGKPLYLWTYEKLCDSNLFEEIILVCHPDWLKEIPPSIKTVPGGTTRQESSHLGLIAAGPNTEIVVIHDAVRPFISQRILEENIEAARVFGAADTCIPSTDTIVHSHDGRTISAIPQRAQYLRGQTPQSFSYPLILKAHKKTQQKNATDDCQLILELGREVHIVQGDEANCKITTPSDILSAEFYASCRRN